VHRPHELKANKKIIKNKKYSYFKFLKANKKEVHLTQINTLNIHGLGTRWRPLANNTRLYAGAKLKNISPHTILLGEGGSMYTSNTQHRLKELGLDLQRVHETTL